MVFYFTGTGNSLYAAKQLDTELISIPQIIRGDELAFSADSIGIVCPIYGHEIPSMVKQFIQRSVFETNYLYVVLTYGSRHANAVELAERVFKDSEKTADYITTLKMVDNFLPVFDMDEEVRLDKKVDQQISRIKSDILGKKHFLQEVSAQDRSIHETYLAAVNGAPETVWANFAVSDDCIGCGICTRVCPAGCIQLLQQKAVYSGENCQACYSCIHACPKLAIELNMPEKNPQARYRNENISLSEIVRANNQYD